MTPQPPGVHRVARNTPARVGGAPLPPSGQESKRQPTRKTGGEPQGSITSRAQSEHCPDVFYIFLEVETVGKCALYDVLPPVFFRGYYFRNYWLLAGVAGSKMWLLRLRATNFCPLNTPPNHYGYTL